jgi:uncharacterized protein YndB with AHSA1/START domain
MKSFLMALAVAVQPQAAAGEPVDVATRQAADGSHIMIHEVVVNAPLPAVWAAVSTADGWKTWAAPAAWTPQCCPDILETSYSPGARAEDASTIKQQIVARIPEVLMVFRTVKAPKGFPDFETYSKVTSVLQLEPVADGKTKVRLIGAGYADTDAGRRLLGFFQKGNSASLDWLRTRFDEGPIDWARKAAVTKK